MKIKNKTLTKSNEQAILENSNFLNNQNYVLGNNEKIKILEDFLINKDETIVPFYQGKLVGIIIAVLYYTYNEKFNEYIFNYFKNLFILNEGLLQILIYYGIIIIGLLLSWFYFYLIEHFHINKQLEKGKAKVYKKKIGKIKFYGSSEIGLYVKNKSMIREHYILKSVINKLDLK